MSRYRGVTTPARKLFALVGAAASLLLAGSPARALVIKPVFDASITSRADAAQIESAFAAAASGYQAAFSNAATINIGVSWGAVKGQTIGGSELGASVDNLYGYFSFSQIAGYLKTVAANNATSTALKSAVKYLGATAPAGVANYAVASAEAKALGLISPTQSAKDGYIGFNSGVLYDFDPTDGIVSTAYDFQSVAAHEIAEVLGRVSGLQNTNPTFRTPMDLFRYGAPGVRSFTYGQAAYFSIDGGVTRLGDFNNKSGDRGDWLASTTGLSDVQSATTRVGHSANLTVADLTLLDALGWGGVNAGNSNLASPGTIVRNYANAGVPEPETWLIALTGFALCGAALRRRPIAAGA